MISCARWRPTRLEPDRPHQQEDHQDPEGPRALGKIGHAAWPRPRSGLHFNTTMNDWHTCKASGDIRASNPCSEYMFLDDTACNLASRQPDHLLRHHDQAVRRGVLRASLSSWDRRARNLGHDGAVSLQGDRATLVLNSARSAGLCQYRRPVDDHGLSYDSKEGRALCGALTRCHDRRQLFDLGRDGPGIGPLPRLQEEFGHMLR